MHLETVGGHPVLLSRGMPVPSFDTYTLQGPNRLYLDLGGSWAFRPDPSGEGGAQGWQRDGTLASGWTAEAVPQAIDEYAGRQYAFVDGYFWLRRSFVVPRSWHGRFVKLMVLGAGPTVDVWVNGVPVAHHEGATFPFAADVTSALRYGGQNAVAVRVHRRKWGTTNCSSLPPATYDWWPWAGILHEVFLEATAACTVSKLVLRPSGGVLSGYAVVNNRAGRTEKGQLTLNPGAGTGGANISVSCDIAPGSVATLPFAVRVPNAAAWSPAAPKVYTAEAFLSSGDALRSSWGMAGVQVEGTRLLMGGSPVFFKGVCWHMDYPGRGMAMTQTQFQNDLKLMRQGGINGIRLTHYPRPPYVYEQADQLGIALLDEVPNYWVPSSCLAQDLGVGSASRQAVQAMVWNAVNHPSVFGWSLCNESPTNSSLGSEWVRALAGEARDADPLGRPVTFASASRQGSRFSDLSFYQVDILGVNMYFGMFYGNAGETGSALDQLRSDYPGKPVLITESGNWAVKGRSGSGPGSEAYQADYLSGQWQQVAPRADFVAGHMWFDYADYKSEHQPQSAIPYVGTLGLLTRDRQPKESWHTYSSLTPPQP